MQGPDGAPSPSLGGASPLGTPGQSPRGLEGRPSAASARLEVRWKEDVALVELSHEGGLLAGLAAGGADQPSV